MAFYKQGHIKHLFKIIGRPIPKIKRKLVSAIANSGYATNTTNYNPEEEVEFIALKHVRKLNCINDTKNSRGKNVAYVQRQRYTTYDKIIKAKYTSQL